MTETREICELNGFVVRHAITFDHLGYRLPFGVRQAYNLAGELIPSLLTGLLVLAEKPAGWTQREEDPASYFRTIAGATPYKVLV